jgi:hypothetical protein
MMSIAKHETISKVLIGGAIAVTAWVGGAAPGSTDPNPAIPDPNLFSVLSCSCQETAPASSPALREETDQGIRQGLSTWSPGLPAPA